MDYKEKYKNVMEVLKKAASDPECEDERFCCVVYDLFPELKESEDERIRKELIEYIKDQQSSFISAPDCRDKYEEEENNKYNSWIAWLEKQGKHSIYNVPSREVILAIWDLGNEWKELTNGSISTEYGTQLDYIQKHWHESTYYLTVKQGEQKPIIEMKSAEESLGVSSEEYNDIVNECVYGEQKPADKVEPKFHKSDWITNGDYTWKIVEVKPLDYILQSQDGNIVDDTISHVDEQFHSFTIEDAKDGDVLAVEPMKDCPNSFIAIYKERGLNFFNSYCFVSLDGEFNKGTKGHDIYLIHPATKEQRDLLFQKMKEAGFEWDSEKKELKKISQRMISAEAKEAMYDKPTDNDMVEALRTEYEKGRADAIAETQKEWSEEDENKMRAALAFIKSEFPKKGDEEIMEDTIEWLKSLKPKKQWKPSGEQMKALHDLNLTGNISYAGQGQILIELYNDLKKLTE